MKNTAIKLAYFALIFLVASCSSFKVVDSYNSESVSTLYGQKILVIARAADERNRKAFEDEMVNTLNGKDLNAFSSYKEFPGIDPSAELSAADIEQLKKLFVQKGFNAVVVSSIKDIDVLSESTVQGGYEAGASVGSVYNYSSGFFAYYGDPYYLPRFKGVDVPVTVTTETNTTYVLQTIFYNLDLPENKQLVAAVTSKIVDPLYAYTLAKSYAKSIVKQVPLK